MYVDRERRCKRGRAHIHESENCELLRRDLETALCEQPVTCDRAERHLVLRLRRAGVLHRARVELAGSIGAASAHVMLSKVVSGEAVSLEEVMQMADETQQEPRAAA